MGDDFLNSITQGYNTNRTSGFTPISGDAGLGEYLNSMSTSTSLKLPDAFNNTMYDQGAGLDLGTVWSGDSPLGEEETGFWANLFGNKNFGANLAGLAGAFSSLVSLPSMYKNARLQNKALQANINAFEEDRSSKKQQRKDFNINDNNETAVA